MMARDVAFCLHFWEEEGMLIHMVNEVMSFFPLSSDTNLEWPR